MHIQQITIKNFRCFEDVTVKLDPEVNIFVGNNGSGKSAVLDAIASAINPYLYTLKRRVIKEEDPEEPYLYQSDLQIKQEKVNSSTFDILIKDLPSYSVSYQKNTDNNIDSKLDYFGPSIRERFHEHLEILKTFPAIAYYRCQRNLKDIPRLTNTFDQEFDQFNALENALDATVNFTDLANWFFVRELQELRERNKRRDFDFELPDLKQVRKAILTIIAPNARVYFTQATSVKLMVEWETETGEKLELSLSQLSSGYRNMLALVMDFARRLVQANPQMENPLEAEAVLMIDELDLHLHPTWQQKIIPDLRKVFTNTQIIATTHSPEIVTTVERHQVKILEDYQIKECPSPTRGMKSSDIVRYVLGLDNLRPDTEESRNLTALFNAIDNRNLEEAKLFRDKLQDWKSFDPDITRADMQIRRLEREMTA